MDNNLTATIIIYYMDGLDQWHTSDRTSACYDYNKVLKMGMD
jgi:hypothetical protein